MALTLQPRLADWPGANVSMYCVRCGDQSSGSTISPAALRLTMFIATHRGGDFSVPLFVTTVLYRIWSPVFTVVYPRSIEICRGSCGARDTAARAGDVLRELTRQTTTHMPTPMYRPKDDQNLLALPPSRRRPGLAYRKSSPKTRTANSTGDTNQTQSSGRSRLLTRIFDRKCVVAMIGFTCWRRFPINPVL